jgi:hypothetical protein
MCTTDIYTIYKWTYQFYYIGFIAIKAKKGPDNKTDVSKTDISIFINGDIGSTISALLSGPGLVLWLHRYQYVQNWYSKKPISMRESSTPRPT